MESIQMLTGTSLLRSNNLHLQMLKLLQPKKNFYRVARVVTLCLEE